MIRKDKLKLFRELTGTEFKILSLIEFWRDGYKENMIPNMDYMYEHLDVSVRTISRAIKLLKEKGILIEENL